MERKMEGWDYFWDLGVMTVKELETDEGILASAKHEIYGCIFGRDSLVTILSLLKAYKKTKHKDFLSVSRKVLLTLADLQGRSVNIESGEEPGKIIHEYRPEKHEQLTQQAVKPWYLYPDQIMRNYDTVDATPLYLIACYRYLQQLQNEGKQDPEFTQRIMPSVKASLNWIFWYGDSNGDGLIDYQLRTDRTYGGLMNQGWMDSDEVSFHETGEKAPYPIALVEAQAYAYCALRMWAKYFATTAKNQQGQYQRTASYLLDKRADELKQTFNSKYVIQNEFGRYLAAAIDGNGRPMTSVRSTMGHCLWAALNKEDDGYIDGIVDQDLVGDVVKLLMSPAMFEPEAGVRTLSRKSRGYRPNSYHSGSIWPHDNGIVADGFENYEYMEEAALVRIAMLKAVTHFGSPVELYVYNEEGYRDYLSPIGTKANQTQAWAAAAIIGAVADKIGESSSGS